MTAILGISAFYHDSAAALVVDGEIVAAAQEERFTRKKHDARFPFAAVGYCLQEGNISTGQIDYVAYYDKPLTKFERLLETYLAFFPRGFRSFRMAMRAFLKDKLFMRRTIRQGFDGYFRAPILFLDHHESHAASAFFPSPFDEAAILTLDGVGEWSTTTLGKGAGSRIELTHHLEFPHSLGLLYSAFTSYCGFTVNSGEYKLMGLAPYGRPIYQEVILKHLMDLKPDGSFWLNMKYFNYCQGLTMTHRRFHDLFGGPPRRPDAKLEQRHMDVAASIQKVTEEVMLRLGHELHRRTGSKNLVMAGGVALNCVANGRLLREGPFEHIWIQPAAGDAGGALGAALFVWHQLLQKPRHLLESRIPETGTPAARNMLGCTPRRLPFWHVPWKRSGKKGTAPLRNGDSPLFSRALLSGDSQKASLLGPHYDADEIRQLLETKGCDYRTFADEAELLDEVTDLLAQGKVVGWFHGRMEFGPRALGARSILGDARSPTMQTTMNQKIKFRESFRPFAPVVLRSHVHEWFAMRPDENSPYMLLVAPVREKWRLPLSSDDRATLRDDPDLVRRVSVCRSTVPAITHVDYSARVQTVDERHGRFYRLLQRFHERTGCPVLVNTSFNLSWEPIVCTPQEAYKTFMLSEMDVLVLEDCVVMKAEQSESQPEMEVILASSGTAS